MVETVVTVVLEVGKCLAAPIGRQFMYLYNYNSNIDNLETEVGKLKDARDEVKHQVDAAKDNVEQIKQNVQKWQENVNSTVHEAETLIAQKENNRCFNLINRYKHSRKASKKMNAVTELLQDKGTFGKVSDPTTHEDLSANNKYYEDFESRMSVLNDVVKALDNADVEMIGVYGMGGIGKTTLVKEVKRQAVERKLFDVVVFVEVNDTPDIKKIQEKIANKLGLKLDDETDERANKLHARLKNGDKILVILDNIWEELDLMTVGIPSGTDHGGCKLLLTARDLNVLQSMDSSENFTMGVLKEEEAWGLFKKMAGDVIDQIGDLQSLPNDVCKECGGLPIAIVTVARALRNKRRRSQWENALQELKLPSPTEFTGVLEKAYSKIALSYNYLKGEELKKIFLLCSLTAYGASVSDLLKYVIGLDILERPNLTMKQARNRLDTLLRELKDSCLLLDGSTDERFSMHDVVRDVGITIGTRDQQVLTERNDIDREWKDNGKLEKCTKISLLDRDIISKHLPEGLHCPKLEFFYIRHPFKICDKFFTGMPQLHVLKLIPVSSLPSSLGLLINLRTLCLDCGMFEDVAIVGELKKLKILSLRYCHNIKKLPSEIGKLTQLMLLDLSNCQQLKVIAPTVLSCLLRLEELYMSGCSVQWEVQEQNVERSHVSASLEELKHLYQLTTLEIDIKDDKILPKGLFSKKLERYKISIGHGSSQFGGQLINGDSSNHMIIERFKFYEERTFNTLKLKLNSPIYSEELLGIKNIEFLCLDKLQGIENVLYELDKEGFSELKHLRVHNNPNLLCIVDSTKSNAFPAFPLLESLILFNLIELEKICNGQPRTGSFSCLKIIEVQSCVKLENIFSFSNITQSLPQLERIRVEDCENMEEIFAIEREDNVNNSDEVIDEIKFCQLRFLTLKKLPKLASFYSEVKTPSTISQDEHHTLTPLFNDKLVFPNLKDLQLSGVNSEKIWDNQRSTMSSCYQNLTRLVMRDCGKLNYAFSSSIVQSFKQLQHLEIGYCKLLKEIVAKGEEAEAVTTFVFPQLTVLKLEGLPELTSFYPGKHMSEWPILKHLKVCYCNKIKIFTSEYLSFHGSTELQSLFLIEKINPNSEELKLSGADSLMTQQDQFSKSLIYRFKVLKIKDDKSANISLEFFRRFNNLRKLKLYRNSYKEIFSYEEDEKHNGKQDSKDSVLQNLEVLEVTRCAKLINAVLSTLSFYSLTILNVADCKALVSLITSSTAKSLVQLTEMKIQSCDMMIEIVENEEDTAEDEIIFHKLKSLSLQFLKSLTCFCYGNNTLKFPFLEEFSVNYCPMMKTFSRGDLRTPRLQKVQTIDHLKRKTKGIVMSNLEKLMLRGKDIMPIWQGQFPEHEFDKVEVLEVIKDESTNIPVKILQRFNDLETLIVKMSSYKELFSCDEDKKLVGIKILEVLYCCNLITLMPSSTCFANLKTLKVCYCSGLRSLVTSTMAKSLVRLQRMTIEECEIMTEVVAHEGDVEKTAKVGT